MIDLYISSESNETVFVWNVDDIYKLRKHHIIGAFIGVHPYKPNQLKRKHLPLKLMPEETKLLLDKGIARLLCSPDQTPDQSVIGHFYEKRKKLCSEQVVLRKENRKQEILMKCKDPDIAQTKSEQVKDVSIEDTHVQIFTECPWKNSNVEIPLKYPSSPEDKVRYAVFKDLWEKNFYITSGSKFGGDFLVYNGDPYIFHSVYIIVCLPTSRKFQSLDIIMYGRLGNQVKKTVALASLNENEEVEYICIDYISES